MGRDYLHEVVSGMLRENTGRHFLDSGGAYGRHWERNQGRSFKIEPSVSVEIDGNDDGSWDYASITFNIYHYMMGHLELDRQTGKLNRAFTMYGNRPENEEKHWLELMEEWTEEMGFDDAHTFNTYNFENLLSQVLQGTMFIHEGETFVLLQVHGGCDARGGYTAPKIFRIVDNDYFWLAMNDVSAHCNGKKFDPRQDCLPGIELDPYCRNNWMSDDSGYHWYFDGCSADEKPLHEYAVYNSESRKLHCRECGGEIIFTVMESF